MITKCRLAMMAALLGLSTLAGAVDLKIENVGRGKKYAWVDSVWNEGAECVEMKFSSSEQLTSDKISYRAYFYDKDNKLVHTMKQPTEIWDYASVNKSSPAVVEPGKKYSVFFGVSDEFTKGEKKWKRVVVVFSSGGKTVAEVFPKDSIALFDFPEKDKLK